ncbi:hypothetical protein PRIPAC_85518, partial [Pristionchus pacificus]|uniref:Uncharacterized protein n=1 Tax=Pristionchus pacificus TaxID=54126 RepID=A0A2A6BNP6_PRIPA
MTPPPRAGYVCTRHRAGHANGGVEVRRCRAYVCQQPPRFRSLSEASRSLVVSRRRGRFAASAGPGGRVSHRRLSGWSANCYRDRSRLDPEVNRDYHGLIGARFGHLPGLALVFLT